MHQLMREHLVDYLKCEELERYTEMHTSLFSYYDERAKVEDIETISSMQEVALVEAANHKSSVDEFGFGKWLFVRAQRLSASW